MTKPLVLIPACTKQIGAYPYHVVQMKYVEAVVRGAGCTPLLLPALGEETDWDTILQLVDGVMLTGSPSNVSPDYFGQSVLDPSLPLDPARDATTLPLIRAAVTKGIPLIAVCRGSQEVNVALGGTLHQAVHQVGKYRDHRENSELPHEDQYVPVHSISITPNGLLASILPETSEMMVNSLHGQGIDQPATGLQVEAIADDGLIEAFTIAKAPGFVLAMQWHPEWKITENPQSMKIFGAFGTACHAYLRKKNGSV